MSSKRLTLNGWDARHGVEQHYLRLADEGDGGEDRYHSGDDRRRDRAGSNTTALDEALHQSHRYDIFHQKTVQVGCCVSFALLCMLTIFADRELDLSANLVQGNSTSIVLFLEDPDVWTSITFYFSIAGCAMAVLGACGVLYHSRTLLYAYLVFMLLFLTYRVMLLVFGFTADDLRNKYFYAQLAISAGVIMLDWVQLYYVIYYFRLLRFHAVYHVHPQGRQQMIPTEELVTLMNRLGQKPKMSQIVELLSYINPDATTFSFEEFCQIEAEYLRLRRKEITRARERAQAERRAHGRQMRPGGAARSWVGDAGGAGTEADGELISGSREDDSSVLEGDVGGGRDGATVHSAYDDRGWGDGLSFDYKEGDDGPINSPHMNGFDQRAKDRDGNLLVRGRGDSAVKRPSIEPFHGPITMISGPSDREETDVPTARDIDRGAT